MPSKSSPTNAAIKNINISVDTVRKTETAFHVPYTLSDKGQFLYLIEGICILKVEEVSYIIRPYQLVLIPGGKKYGIHFSGGDNLLLYRSAFDAEIEERDLFFFVGFSADIFIANIHEKERVRGFFESAVLYAKKDSASAYMGKCGAISSVIAECTERMRKQKKDEGRFSEVISYMHAHVDSKISLTDIAAMFYMQPSYFVRKFKMIYNASPMRLYNILRAEKAMNLLNKGNCSTAEAGRAIGMEDGLYFSKFFKAYTGVSKNEYRRLFAEEK